MATPQEKLNRSFVKAAENGKLADMEMYLIKGAEIDARGSAWQLGLTAIGSAAWMGHANAVRFLIGKGANINVRDGNGMTPLMHAADMQHVDCAEALLKAGAGLDYKDTKGRTAFDIAFQRRKPQLVQLINRFDMQRKAAAVAPTPEPPAKTEPPKDTPDIVILRQQAGDRLLEDVFNFVALERVTFVRREAGAPIEAMLRENFADMSNTTLLEKAYAEHQRRGGTLSADMVFPDAKPKIQLPGAGK